MRFTNLDTDNKIEVLGRIIITGNSKNHETYLYFVSEDNDNDGTDIKLARHITYENGKIAYNTMTILHIYDFIEADENDENLIYDAILNISLMKVLHFASTNLNKTTFVRPQNSTMRKYMVSFPFGIGEDKIFTLYGRGSSDAYAVSDILYNFAEIQRSILIHRHNKTNENKKEKKA